MSENIEPGDLPLTGVPTIDGPSLQGRRIVANRYEILSRLGQGGMGEVWHAYDLKLRVDVALKSLRRTTAEAVEALRHEVRTAREVISPNVCRIFDLVEAEQELISMEYIDGITLTSMLVKKGALQLGEARDIAAQFLAGLEAIHQAGLVHRDLKPENIMITRTGRVVVMDFGIAKQVAQIGGTIAGTIPYMSPEQLAGEKVDARSDVFAAGVVLAEMIHPEGVYSQKTREVIWNAVRKSPVQIPESPWKAVIARTVAEKPENRFASAGALARALEEVTLRVETVEERKPYPGLSSFTAADAEYFYGRELEVETIIKKLQQLHLMALIGPSGAGKTSFLRAGLIPAMPPNWRYVFCTPGDAPLINLGQSLVPELSGDTEAMVKMVRLEDTDTALWLLRRWKEKYSEVLLIVDRFEELFTLNSSQTQAQFAELLGRAALEGDVRVLLAMRDDFLMLCHDHAGLVPIFSELTGLSPLSGAALRRALVQPALRCNYRFEDETLVDEILADVEKERGALPLMAFAAARVWEKRDRQSGTLTRQAYKEIGGVAGALAQHAENTMERIGTERQPIAREIFRNLITAQNTRAARDTEELLSVFPEKQIAQEVLRALIDARLLTSFEQQDEAGKKSRVEIIHESLLSNWPRLVRWQTQDADSAQLRDQLRQAAQLWEQRSRSEDLLWTGGAYLEFQAWRQRYAGGLTTTEEAFAQAMSQRATKRRRQRRIIETTIFIVLLAILALISSFWRGEKTAREQSEVARKKAVTEALRREAAQLLALGRLKISSFPTAALAYAIASLEKADSNEGRRFALEALSQGPTATILPMNVNFLEFSADGKWLASGGRRSGIYLWAETGGSPKLLSAPDGSFRFVQFGPISNLLAGGGKDVRFWSVPDPKEIGMAETTHDGFFLTKSELITVNPQPDARGIELNAWTIPVRQSHLLTTLDAKAVGLAVDAGGEWIHYGLDTGVYRAPLKPGGPAPAILLGRHKSKVVWVSINREADRLISGDQDGEIRLWDISSPTGKFDRTLHVKGPQTEYLFAQAGSRLGAFFNLQSPAATVTETAFIWDLSGPPDADPFVLRGEETLRIWTSIHPKGTWLATSHGGKAILWPLERLGSYVLRGQSPKLIQVAFTQDGKHLISSSADGTVRMWPMSAEANAKTRVILKDEIASFAHLSVDRNGMVLTGSNRDNDNRVFVVPVTGDARLLPVPQHGFEITGVKFSSDGRTAAAAQAGPNLIRVWNLESNSFYDLDPQIPDEDPGCGWGAADAGMVMNLGFTPQDELITAGRTALRIWDLEKRTSKMIRPCRKELETSFDLSASGDRIVVLDWAPTRSKPSVLSIVNQKSKTVKEIASHGNRLSKVAIDPTGSFIVTGDEEGVVRVGPSNGEDPHILFGHRQSITGVAISPDGNWIASGSDDGTIRLWRTPEGKPFHTLPYQELLHRLLAMTNLRVIPDSKADAGYRVDPGPFPGWKNLPNW